MYTQIDMNNESYQLESFITFLEIEHTFMI